MLVLTNLTKLYKLEKMLAIFTLKQNGSGRLQLVLALK